MATKVAYTLREDKQELHKQFGCMNGIFQVFDRRYLLGLHRHGRGQNRLSTGENENGIREFKKFKNSSEKEKEKIPKKTIEKSRASVDSSRNSFSSSCSSTTFSSFDCSKRVQTEWQIGSNPTSPSAHKNQPDWSLQPLDIRDVVKDSMTRDIRVRKNEQPGPVMKYVDSPRPFLPQNPVQYDRKDRNLTKVQMILSGVKDIKEIPRLSCDEKESQYFLKSTFKVKDLPRLSLDGRQNSTSNNRPSSGLVARLMGLESLDSTCEVQAAKIKRSFDEELVSKKAPLKNVCQSVYGEMEKRLSALEFRTSGKDLRALKQILEAMQTTTRRDSNKEQSFNRNTNSQPVSPAVNGISSPKRRELLNKAAKPAKIYTDFTTITGLHAKDPKTRDKKAKDSLPEMREEVHRENPVPSPRLRRTKNGAHGKSFQRSLSDSSRIKKQSHSQPIVSDLKTRKPKTKRVNPMQNSAQSFRHNIEKRSLSQESETNSSLDSQKVEIARNDQPKENHIRSEKEITEKMVEDEPMVELAKLTIERPSPVSVLDAFDTEDTPSPVVKKPNAFTDYESIFFDETDWNQAGIDDLANGTDIDTDQHSEFNHIELEKKNRPIHRIESLNFSDEEVTVNKIAASPYKTTEGDHKYISEILLASGFLKDLDSAIGIVQLHPTSRLIKPELFHFLENPRGHTELTDDECHKKNLRLKSKEGMRKKMIFDSVNDILFHKLTMSGSFEMWTQKTRGIVLDGEKLLKEVCFEIDNLQTRSDSCLCDDDDEVKNLVSADVNRKSEGWISFCHEIPGLVLDIERLIFKDLINEVVNAEVTNMQDWPRRTCRQLFPM